jgi:hypothetical protein
VCSHARGNSAVEFFDAADAPLYDSLGGQLLPSESVPMGRINHEHVIPFSELSLKELIGSGAEGKVCVGRGWVGGVGWGRGLGRRAQG